MPLPCGGSPGTLSSVVYAGLEDQLDRFPVAQPCRAFARDHSPGDGGRAYLIRIQASAIVLEQELEAVVGQALEFQPQRAVRRLAFRLAGRGGLDAVHHGVADELNGDVLDGRLIVIRDQTQAVNVESHGLLVLLRHVLGQRAKRVLEASRRGRAVGPRAGGGFGADLRATNFGACMIWVPFSVMLGICGGAAASRPATADGAQGFEGGELTVELVELDRERQEIAAAQDFAAAQIVQGILEQPRRAFQRGELECRGVAPDPIDLVERLLEFVRKRPAREPVS